MLHRKTNSFMKNNIVQTSRVARGVIGVVFAALLVVIDQVSKYFVMQALKPIGSFEVIKNFFFFSYVENRGAAFGSFENMRWVFMPLTAIGCILLAVFLFLHKKHTFLSYTAVILVLAGGIGNMIDRIFLGYVVDFINFPFFGYVFNFADCCVVVGAVLFVIAFGMNEYREHKKELAKKAEEETADREKAEAPTINP